MSDQKKDVEWSDWLPAGAVVCSLRSNGDGEQIKRALLDRLASGSVHAVCTSSIHTYGMTTFSEDGLAAIRTEEWPHYVPDDSALEQGVVRMQWTSQVSLPLVGLCPIMATYFGVRLSFEDLTREFPEVPWSRRGAMRSAQAAAVGIATSAANRPNNVINLEAASRFRRPIASKRSAPRQ